MSANTTRQATANTIEYKTQAVRVTAFQSHESGYASNNWPVNEQ